MPDLDSLPLLSAHAEAGWMAEERPKVSTVDGHWHHAPPHLQLGVRGRRSRSAGPSLGPDRTAGSLWPVAALPAVGLVFFCVVVLVMAIPVSVAVG